MTPKYWPQAKRELARADPVLKPLIRRHRSYALGSRGDAYQTLARAIVGQQISVKAAQSVWDRLLAAVGAVSPAAIDAMRVDALRACGLSERKALYLRDLAAHFTGGLFDLAAWQAMGDEDVIAELIKVRGIGRWTAEMFLIFYMARPDVLPLADLGLQRAIQLQYGSGRKLSERRMRAIAACWAPWRSVATWYLWRSLDPIPVEY